MILQQIWVMSGLPQKNRTVDLMHNNHNMNTNLTQDQQLPKVPLIANVHGTILNTGDPNSIEIYFINNGSDHIVFNDKDSETGGALIEVIYYIDKGSDTEISRPDALMRTDSKPQFSIYTGTLSSCSGDTKSHTDGNVITNTVELIPEHKFEVAPGAYFRLEGIGIITDFPARQANLFVRISNVYKILDGKQTPYAQTTIIVPVQISPIYTDKNIGILQRPDDTNAISVNGKLEIMGNLKSPQADLLNILSSKVNINKELTFAGKPGFYSFTTEKLSDITSGHSHARLSMNCNAPVDIADYDILLFDINLHDIDHDPLSESFDLIKDFDWANNAVRLTKEPKSLIFHAQKGDRRLEVSGIFENLDGSLPINLSANFILIHQSLIGHYKLPISEYSLTT